MNIRKHSFAVLVLTALSAPAFAQTATAPVQDHNTVDVQRNVNQQNRIEQGLQSGQLNSHEAGALEKQQAHIDQMEKHDDRNGAISAAEQGRLKVAQDHASQAIARDKHNAANGNPASRSSERLQKDVQRSANQQQRTENGLERGALTNHEAGELERGQSHVNGAEARAGAHGGVDRREQARIQGQENHQSARVYHKKHNARHHIRRRG